VEVGGEKINFLDLTISLDGGGYTYGIYRKPTTTDITVHGSSFCPLPHKLAAYHYYINRLVSIPPTAESYDAEVSTIKHLASVNNIRHSIREMIRKKAVKQALSTLSTL